MTERKPAGMSFESWIDKQIREATERGEFDNLPGAGKPIPGLGKRRDEMWWVRDKMRREQLTFTHPTFALRKAAEVARTEAMAATSEAAVRDIVAEINKQIVEAIKRPSLGPPLNLMPFDVERVLQEWREQKDQH
jgi:hypothetical protein